MDVTRRRLYRDLTVLLLLGAGAVLWLSRSGGTTDDVEAWCLDASLLMQQATHAVAAHRTENGPPIDPSADVNRTGLIGAFYTPMTTTVGQLEAKRTSTNPDMAGLLVALLHQAGVRSGDVIAIGASGSFPALILATLSAARAMNVTVALIVSLGASQWGANLEDLTWLDIESLLVEQGVLSTRSAALSVGGDLDVGRDMDSSTSDALRDRILATGYPLIGESNLASNVDARVEAYQRIAREREIAAFVNIGGSWANLGTDASVLNLAPGVVDSMALPPVERQGVIQAMAARGVPVIHLLNLKELAQQYGLPWDPSPLPSPGSWAPRDDAPLSTSALSIACGYLMVVAIWGLLIHRARRRQGAL